MSANVVAPAGIAADPPVAMVMECAGTVRSSRLISAGRAVGRVGLRRAGRRGEVRGKRDRSQWENIRAAPGGCWRRVQLRTERPTLPMTGVGHNRMKFTGPILRRVAREAAPKNGP